MSAGRRRRSRLIGAAIAVLVLAAPRMALAGETDAHAGVSPRSDSLVCLSCHDGVMAPDSLRHPIGMAYDASPLRRAGTLRPSASLAPSIRLEDGRVGCSTCHDLSSSLRSKLVVANTGSALCFACHRL
ncbi:MAG: cytochrome c3 family protein [Candidatus Rokubacteria bacterium]|nr:cytochrome c3 family protein [Candidatus Rokubacteria bacterium]MBI3108058.1 cytochrome c3 family protein [Candidatus Rokubacteria bacterium]